MKKAICLAICSILILTTVCLSSCFQANEKDSFTIDENGNLIVTYSDGSFANLGKVKGEDGKDGADGKDGIDGIDGKNGRDGVDGVNEKAVKNVIINDFGEIVINYTDGSSENMGKLTDEMIWIKKNDVIKINVNRLELRTAPNENANIEAIATSGQQYTRSYTNGVWSEIISNGKTYYVLNEYITTYINNDSGLENGTPTTESGWGELIK